MTMNMISVLLVVAVVMGTAAGEAPMEYKEMTLINQCNFPVWPVVTGGSDGRAAPAGALAPRGGRRSWLAGAFWSGTVWGRTGCRVQTQTIGRQQRRRLACDSGVRTASGALFATTASFEFLGGVAKPDTMYVSVEQGFNLPMEVVPAPKCGGPASAMGCAALAQQVCPARRFQIRKGNNVTACAARFPRHDDDSAGGGAGAGAGAGAGMATTFRKACPSAFPFRTAVLCPPSTASYRLVFCPASRRSHPRHP